MDIRWGQIKSHVLQWVFCCCNCSDDDFGWWWQNNKTGASNWSAELRSLFAGLLSSQGPSCQYWFIQPRQFWIIQSTNFFHSPSLEMCAQVREVCLYKTLERIACQPNFERLRETPLKFIPPPFGHCPFFFFGGGGVWTLARMVWVWDGLGHLFREELSKFKIVQLNMSQKWQLAKHNSHSLWDQL